MNPWLGVGLALAALVLGGVLLGWQGVIFATTGIIFWLLLQMSRLMRLMQKAGKAPMGSVGSAVMLNSQLHEGMTLVDLLTLTGSLGQKLGDAPKRYRWTDPGDVSVEVVLEGGKVSRWTLIRPEQASEAAAD
ncbi:hypothetical protein ACG04Q_22150 [Roseateles sp. DXS20W]|uniref:Glycerate kinase n=1 Tax=Pelomonas lactea TaxID=3299030 RepID=A0ABW7GQN8_9BURK